MLDFRGKYIFLSGNKSMSLFETEKLLDLIENPLTGDPFLPQENIYIKFHYDCYVHTNNMQLSWEILDNMFTWYDIIRRTHSIKQLEANHDSREVLDIVRCFLTITDFQSHFREFNPSDSESERYERDLAEKALTEGTTTGLWLLRHSSKNRPGTPEEVENLRVTGTRYYAVSYVDDDYQIQHVLMKHSVGHGWHGYNKIFPCFLDCLEYILLIYNIPYSKRIDAYIKDI
jgi:hypothetical protein